jgi:hypothetical protein
MVQRIHWCHIKEEGWEILVDKDKSGCKKGANREKSEESWLISDKP